MSDETPLSKQQIAAQGRALEESTWHLPARYELQASSLELPPDELKEKNPEMFALWQKVQADEKRLRESAASGVTLSSQDMFRARAAQRAEEHRVTIANLDKQIAEIAFGGAEGDLDELQAAKIAVRHRRAQELALMGRYDLAAQETPDPAYRDHYMKILDAVFRDDGESCECPKEVRGSGEHTKISVPSQHIAEEIYSIKHARLMPVLRCGTCGDLNVADAPRHLLEQRAHRVRAMQIAGTLLPTEAAAKLAAKGHTTEALISKRK